MKKQQGGSCFLLSMSNVLRNTPLMRLKICVQSHLSDSNLEYYARSIPTPLNTFTAVNKSLFISEKLDNRKHRSPSTFKGSHSPVRAVCRQTGCYHPQSYCSIRDVEINQETFKHEEKNVVCWAALESNLRIYGQN